MVLSEVAVDIVAVEDEARFRDLIRRTTISARCRGWPRPCAMSLTIKGAEVRGARPLDRLGLWHPVWPFAPRHQQRALSDPPRR